MSNQQPQSSKEHTDATSLRQLHNEGASDLDHLQQPHMNHSSASQRKGKIQHFNMIARTLMKLESSSNEASKLFKGMFASAALVSLGLLCSNAQAYTLNGPLYTGVSEQMMEQKKADKIAEQTEAEEIAKIEKTAQEKEAEEIKSLLAAGKTPMLIYGDNKLSRFLGCLNCTPNYYISIWNSESPFGSPTGHISIWNMTTEYGAVASKFSPWNLYGSNPPAIIDPAGKLYGFLTRNEQIENRFFNNFAEHLYYNYNTIRVNPKKWIKRFFAVEIIKGVSTISLDELAAMPKVVKKEDMLAPVAPQQNRKDDIKGRPFSFDDVAAQPDDMDDMGMDDSAPAPQARPSPAQANAPKTPRPGFNVSHKNDKAAQEAMDTMRRNAVAAPDSIHLTGNEFNSNVNANTAPAQGQAAPLQHTQMQAAQQAQFQAAPEQQLQFQGASNNAQGQAQGGAYNRQTQQERNAQQNNGNTTNSSGINGRDVHSLFQR